ncbi:MAG TPA: HD domain-containing phosphohydrolase [Xanthomonadaceae bacterium]|jgi:response regulator RpfG family c-di-GMP phosphodiesterase
MFAKDEAPAASTPVATRWRVLLVDDEPDVHTITKLALSRFELDGRGLEFLHAYSGAQAREFLRNERDIALAIVDVVMENETAGLELARWMRQDLNNHFTRIVLRTGQPGQAPEERVIVEYDINDYKEKTELDRKKLFTTVFSALRAYRDIVRIDDARRHEERFRIGLETVIAASAHVLEQHSMREFAGGLLQQVASLLHLDERGVLVRLSALHAKSRYEVLASVGDCLDERGEIMPEIVHALQMAEQAQHHVLHRDCFVGYFPSQHVTASLLYLNGVSDVDDLDMRLIDIFSTHVSLAFENLLLNKEMFDTQAELINKLGNVVESRSAEAGNHVRRMAEVCYLLARALGYDEAEAELIRRASPMHDIGKVAIPDTILLNPGKLDAAQWKVMQQHPTIGHDILKGSERPILEAAATIAHQHHERWDGSGYPQGLSGRDIHPHARIVAVADVFDALTHVRCYKPAWPLEEVIAYMRAGIGSHLDGEIVEKLLENLDSVMAVNERFPD